MNMIQEQALLNRVYPLDLIDRIRNENDLTEIGAIVFEYFFEIYGNEELAEEEAKKAIEIMS